MAIAKDDDSDILAKQSEVNSFGQDPARPSLQRTGEDIYGTRVILVARYSMRRLGNALPAFAIFSSFLTLLLLLNLYLTSRHPSVCSMTYSRPVYTIVTENAAQTNCSSPFMHPKYRLFALHMRYHRAKLTGYPILFIPGNLGSYKQARSIAHHLDKIDPLRFDVFTIDFREEWSGFSGEVVAREAHFLNMCIKFILRIYENQIDVHEARPNSVIIIAHSLGGVVTRYAKTLDNYQKQSIAHVISLGSPFQSRSYPFDPALYAIYEQMIKFRSLDQTSFISISGGHKDIIVPSFSSALTHLAEKRSEMMENRNEVGLSILTMAIPSVRTSVDHLCMLWCSELLDAVAKSVASVLQKTGELQFLVETAEWRVRISQYSLLGNVSDTQTINDHLEKMSGIYFDEHEWKSYNLFISQWLWIFFRLYFAELWTVIFAVAVIVFSFQIRAWQQSWDPSFKPQELESLGSCDRFPSFLYFLHPYYQLPSILQKTCVTIHKKTLFRQRKVVFTCIVVVIVIATCTSLATSFNFHVLSWKRANVMMRFLSLCLAYAYTIGSLYIVVVMTSFICKYGVHPIVSSVHKLARNMKLPWFVYPFIWYALAAAAIWAHSGSLQFSKLIAACALITFAIVSVSVLALASGYCHLPSVASSHCHYQQSLSILIILTYPGWTGKIFNLWIIARDPALVELDETTFVYDALMLMTKLWVILYAVVVAHHQMIPYPPAAFFSALEKRSDEILKPNMTQPLKTRLAVSDYPQHHLTTDDEDAMYTKKMCDMQKRHTKNHKKDTIAWSGSASNTVSHASPVKFGQNVLQYLMCKLCTKAHETRKESPHYQQYMQASWLLNVWHTLVPILLQIGAAMHIVFIENARSAHWLFNSAFCLAVVMLVYQKAFNITSKIRNRISLVKSQSEQITSKSN